MPATTFETLPIADSDRVVLEMRVEPGTSLHGYGPAGGPHSVYIRHAALSVPATVHETEAIVHARAPVTASRWPYG